MHAPKGVAKSTNAFSWLNFSCLEILTLWIYIASLHPAVKIALYIMNIICIVKLACMVAINFHTSYFFHAF